MHVPPLFNKSRPSSAIYLAMVGCPRSDWTTRGLERLCRNIQMTRDKFHSATVDKPTKKSARVKSFCCSGCRDHGDLQCLRIALILSACGSSILGSCSADGTPATASRVGTRSMDTINSLRTWKAILPGQRIQPAEAIANRLGVTNPQESK
jgi:hypothetical protein